MLLVACSGSSTDEQAPHEWPSDAHAADGQFPDGAQGDGSDSGEADSHTGEPDATAGDAPDDASEDDVSEDVASDGDAAEAPDAGPLFYKNVVLDESGDPDCNRFGSAYYLYLPDQVRKDGQAVGGRVLGFTSTDLVNWTSLGEVFNNVDEAYGGNQTIGLWAPEVLSYGGKYYLYYVNVMSGGAHPEVGNKDIVVIESDDPADFHGGTGRKVLLDDDYAFIDPSPYQDPVTDALYLVFKRRGVFGTGSELRIRPLATPTAFGGSATTLIESQDVPDSLSIVEHPQLWRQGNLYYLLFSRGQGDRPTYAIAYATSKSVTGPYVQRGVLFGSDSNLTTNLAKKVIAPGASSIVRDGSGATWMVYRQKKTAEVTFADRGVCIDPIEVRPAEHAILGSPTKGVLLPGPVPL